MKGETVGFYMRGSKGINQENIPVFMDKMSTAEYCKLLLDAFSWKDFNFKTSEIEFMTSPKLFHRHSMSLLKGDFRHLVVDYHQTGNYFIKGIHVKLHSSSLNQANAYIGDNVYIHKKSQLHEQVVLCKESYIDKFSDITNSIIMPGVYVGPFLNVKNSIVTGSKVIRIDSNVILNVDGYKITHNILNAA